MAAGNENGTLTLWRASHGRVSTIENAHTGAVAGVALIEDGRFVATGGNDGMVRLWEAGGQLVATLDGHAGVVYGLAASRNGQLLASASGDGTVKLWDLSSRACVRTLRRERRYERSDITGLKGITAAQRHALLELGAVEQSL